MFFISVVFAAVLWCDGSSPPLHSFFSVLQTELEEYFGGVPLFRTLLPTQTHSSHLMDQILTHSHTHTHPKYPKCTHTKSPLTLTSLYTLSVMLQGLTEPQSVCDCLFFWTSVTQMVISHFKTLSRSHWCSSKSDFYTQRNTQRADWFNFAPTTLIINQWIINQTFSHTRL